MPLNEIYTLVYKSKVMYRSDRIATRVRVVRGQTLSEGLFRAVPEGLRKHFVRGKVSPETMAKLTQKGLVAGERKAHVREISFQTGEAVPDPETETKAEAPTLPTFSKMKAAEVVTYADALAWIPAGAVHGEQTKKENVTAIEAAFAVYTADDGGGEPEPEAPDSVGAVPAEGGPSGSFEDV